MKAYRLVHGLAGVECIVVLSVNRAHRLRLVGSLLEAGDPHQFTGSPAQLLALSILTEFLDADEDVTLRGKGSAWKWHRLFADTVLAEHWPEPFLRSTIESKAILRFIAERKSVPALASLFEMEEPCQQDAL